MRGQGGGLLERVSGDDEGGADADVAPADDEPAPTGPAEGIDTDAETMVMVGDSITQGWIDAVRSTLAASGPTDVTTDGPS